MSVSISIDINASPPDVAAIMIDVERWHEWTASISSVQLLTPGPIAVGSRARVRQPQLPPSVWMVTALDPARGFTWVSSGPGFAVTAHHYAAPTSSGARATLGLDYTGLFGWAIARMTRTITLRYVQMEADGLKRHSESARQTPK